MLIARINIIVLLIVFCNLLSAQNRLDSIQQLQEVEVVARTHKEVIAPQKLVGKTLESLNSFSVADAIRYFAGVQIKDYGGISGLKTVDIRSMGTNHMGVFYDGIQLGNAQNGQIDLGKFSLDNIEEISLYNGQKSEIFQAAKDFGSAGTIYLHTRRPRFEKGKKTNIKTIFKTGSFGLVNPSVLWEQKINEKISSSLNAEYVYASGKYKFRVRNVKNGEVMTDTTGIRKNGDVNALRIEGGLNGYVQAGKWNAKAYYYDSERGIPGAIVNNVWERYERQWDRNFFTQGSYQKQVTNNYEFLLNLKYAYDHMRYLSIDEKSMRVDNTFNQNEIYVSMANRYRILPAWEVALSSDYQLNTLYANLVDFVRPVRNTLLIAAATSLDYKRIKMQASLLGSFVFEELLSEKFTSPSNKMEYTPTVFLAYQPFLQHDFMIRAFYKSIFRMPTFNDLYYTNIGNKALKPEYTWQYNIGFQYGREYKYSIIQQINFTADAYYNEIKDKIVAIPKGDGQYRWMMMNLGYVEIRGVDVAIQSVFRFPGDIIFRLNLNYTHQKAQDFTYPEDNDPVKGSYGGQIAYIPWHNGSLIAQAEYKKWHLNYSFIYVGERYHNSANIRDNYEQPWYTHDVALARQFDWSKVKFRVSLEINNLINQQYDVVLNYPMPGTNFKVILKAEI